MNTTRNYGFRVVGDRRAARRPIDWDRAFHAYADCAPAAEVQSESYLSYFTFGSDLNDHIKLNRSERAYNGFCGVSWLFWDIDSADDLEAALRNARGLLARLLDRFRELDDDDPLVFFSGSKGFHIGIPATWEPERSVDLHRVARRFCLDLAEAAGVVVDPSIYSKTRLFRAPNSKHPKTGLHKRRFSTNEIMHLKLDAILDMAKTPEPFVVPAGPRPFASAAAAWDSARRLVGTEGSRPGPSTTGVGGRLSIHLRRFIRDGEVDPARRAVAVFRASAELAEYRAENGFDELVFALLEEAARDSGLSLAEVKKQIRDGLAHGGRTGRREGGAP